MRFRHAFFRVAAPRKPRHRLLRLLLGVLGLALLLVLIAFGVFVGAAMLGAGALLRLWTLRRTATTPSEVALPGEFRVVPKPALPAR